MTIVNLNTSNQSQVIDVQDECTLKQKHFIAYLYKWSEENDEDLDEASMKIACFSLIAEFRNAPCYTVSKLEEYINEHFDRIIHF